MLTKAEPGDKVWYVDINYDVIEAEFVRATTRLIVVNVSYQRELGSDPEDLFSTEAEALDYAMRDAEREVKRVEGKLVCAQHRFDALKARREALPLPTSEGAAS